VVIEPDGKVRVASRGAERRLRDRAGRYHVVVAAPGLVILREELDPDVRRARGGTRIAMAGEPLPLTAVPEGVIILATANRAGELHIFDGEFHRVLAIDQSVLKYAHSDAPDDRLGQVLYRHGLLSRAQLDQVLREVGPEKRLGH